MSDPTPGDLFDRWLAHRAKDEVEGSTASTTPPPPAPPVSDTEPVVPSTPERPVGTAGEVVIQDTKASRAAAKARLERARAQEAAAAAAPRLTELIEAPVQPVRDRAAEPEPVVQAPAALDPDAVLDRVLRSTPRYRPAAPVSVPVSVPSEVAEVGAAHAEPEPDPEPDPVPDPEPEPEAVEPEPARHVVTATPPPPVVEGRRKAPLEVAPDQDPAAAHVGERIAPLETPVAENPRSPATARHHLAAPTVDAAVASRERLAQQLRRPTRVPSQRRGQPVPPRPRTAPDGPTAAATPRDGGPSPARAEVASPSEATPHDTAAGSGEGSTPPLQEPFVRHDRVRRMPEDEDRPRYLSPAERAAASIEHRPALDDDLPAVVELTAPRTPARQLAEYGFLPAAIGALLFLVIGLTGLTWAIAVAAMLGALAVVLLASRAATSSVLRVVVKRGSLEVERRSGWRRFDLESGSTLVTLVGSPSDIGWKAEVEGPDGDRCVLDPTVVDPEEFVRVLRHYRPDA